MVTPADGDRWTLATQLAHVADASYHELIAHLGRTHLYVEPVLLATRRELPAGHRIATLLVPHFWIAGQGWLRRRGRLPGRPLVRPHRLRWRGVRQVHALGRRRVRRQTLP